MEIKDLQAEGICNIIKACQDAKVTKLKLGELEVEFGSVGIQPTLAGTQVTYTAPISGTIKPPEKLKLSKEDEELLSDLEDNQVLLSDPVQWEQNMIDDEELFDKEEGADGRNHRTN